MAESISTGLNGREEEDVALDCDLVTAGDLATRLANDCELSGGWSSVADLYRCDGPTLGWVTLRGGPAKAFSFDGVDVVLLL